MVDLSGAWARDMCDEPRRSGSHPASLYVALLAPVLALGQRAAAEEDYLQGRSAQSRSPVSSLRATDGVFAKEGSEWQGPEAVVLAPGETLEWDLSRPVLIQDIILQADNNDEYLLYGSLDRATWSHLWTAGPTSYSGLSTRSVFELNAVARFVRLEAQGGDGRYSVSELKVGRLQSLAASSVLLDYDLVDVMWGVIVVLTGLALFRGRGDRRTILVNAVVIAAAFLITAKSEVSSQRIDWLRLIAAALALLAVFWERRATGPARSDITHARMVLVASAFLSVLCFLNFLRPQFGQSHLHYYDMRTYMLMAKFLPELEFDGLYVASALAVEEQRGNGDLSRQSLRDLRTHRLTVFSAVRDHAQTVRSRFSDDRWRAFKEDVAYFRGAMGDAAFLDSMRDHGGNATPVWFLAAAALFSARPASDTALWVGVALDMLLLSLAFSAAWRAFGGRTALAAMVVFGAMDFYQFGTNWFGATLRHDWLALWLLAIAVLKLGRPTTAGILVGWSSLIRVFPGLVVLTVAVPAVVALGSQARRPSKAALTAWVRGQHDRLKFLLGVAVSTTVLVTMSFLAFGSRIWLQWWEKVSAFNADDHFNDMSIRTWVTGGPGFTHVLVAMPIVVGVLVLVRRATIPSGAAMAVLLVPVVFSPANYYLHSIFLLVVCAAPSEAAERSEGTALEIVLLLMCAASYFTHSSDSALHFRADTYVMLAALSAFVVVRWRFQRRQNETAIGSNQALTTTAPPSTP